MTIKQYARACGKTAEISGVKSEIIINTFLDELVKEIKKGNQVSIRGFGTFSVQTFKEKKGRNVRTGDPVIIPEYKKIKFKQSKKIIL